MGKRTQALYLGEVGDSIAIKAPNGKIDFFTVNGMPGTYNYSGSAALFIDWEKNVYLFPATPSNLAWIKTNTNYARDESLAVPLTNGFSMPCDNTTKKVWQELLTEARENWE